MNDFHFPTDTADSPPCSDVLCYVSIGYPTLFKSPFIPRCYLCESTENLQCLTVGKREGKFICGGCLDGALRSVDGE